MGEEERIVKIGQQTFVIGRNAAGKSNLLDALAFFSEIARDPLTNVLDRRGGIGAVRSRTPGRGYPSDVNMAVRIAFDDGHEQVRALYGFALKASKAYGYRVSFESCVIWGNHRYGSFEREGEQFEVSNSELVPVLQEDALALPIVGGTQPFARLVDVLRGIRIYSINPKSFREPQPADEGTVLSHDGANAASVVRELRKTDIWPILLEFLRAAVPHIYDVEPKREGTRLALQFHQKNDRGDVTKFDGFEMSDGTLRILGILLALLQQPRPVLIGLEEPEVHVHPGALGVVLDAIRYVSAETQVVVTTQSTELLDADWIKPEDIKIVRWADGASRVENVSEDAAEVLRRHLRTPGQLLHAGALSGADSE